MIYLDHAATSFPKSDEVVLAITDHLRNRAVSPGRTSHRIAGENLAALGTLRRRLAQIIGRSDPASIVLTSGATQSLNMAIKGVIRHAMAHSSERATHTEQRARPHVVTTQIEHHAVLRPLYAMHDRGIIDLTIVAADADWRITPRAIVDALTDATELVVVTHGSNVIGRIQPIAEIAHALTGHDALLCVDAAQTAGLIPIDMDTQPIDVLAASGHKALGGPMGTGLLALGDAASPRIASLIEGGTGSGDERAQPADLPARLEAGTPNMPGYVGLLAAAQSLTPDAIADHLAYARELANTLRTALEQIAGIRVLSPVIHDTMLPMVLMTIAGQQPHETAAILDTGFGIAVRAGRHCAAAAHRVLGTGEHGAVRLSVAASNTPDDIQKTIDAITQVASSAG